MNAIYSKEYLQTLDLEFKAFEIDKNTDLITRAKSLENFLTSIFPIKDQLKEYKIQAANFDILYEFKRNFVQRRAIRKYSKEEVKDYNSNIYPYPKPFELAKQVQLWLEDEKLYWDQLDEAAKFCAYKVYFDPDSIIFQLPKKIDFDNLVETKDIKIQSIEQKTINDKSLDQSHYCIICHDQNKDSCRKGIHEGESWKINPLGNELTGCPLNQKISEMNMLYSEGHIIAALAVVMIDNPLVAATGESICNDCMKSCIFQKQEPVNVPHIETQMLRAVLTLPYGAEIYYLLSRWNPLVCEQKENSSVPKRILVVGLGPAGFAMAYYMLNKGHHVTAIDGLKIDPLPSQFFKPIENWPNLIKDLGPYKPQGFGGVAEYGITDRWDKYNLLLIRMLLERFENFIIKGDFRLGRDITLKGAIEKEKYDYIALCLGAGRPKIPEANNIEARGVISAFSFLASLHMNVQDFTYKMPVVIVGAGLTAIDCAMAALSYNNNTKKEVTIIYRKSLQESPSYRENHHELQTALNKGVKFIENTELNSIETDKFGQILSINNSIPCGTLIYSIGTHPNDKIFEKEAEVFKLYKDQIGIFGDMNPDYTGTVVKALASVREISREK